MRGIFTAAAAALIFAGAPASAAPGNVRPAGQEEPAYAYIPFEPPVGQPLLYRTETTEERNGVSKMSWSTSSYLFSEDGEGYLLTVTQTGTGSGEEEASPVARQLYARLSEIFSRPFVVRISSEALITEVIDGDAYWTAIFDAFDALVEMPDKDGKPLAPGAKEGLRAVFAGMRALPNEARLALLTQTVQPLVDMMGTEWFAGEPVRTSVEVPVPFGGSLEQDIHYSLTSVAEGKATVGYVATFQREDFLPYLERFASTIAPDPAAREKMARELAEMESFRLERRASYDLSTDDGTLIGYHYRQTAEMGAAAKTDRAVKTTTMTRLEGR